MHDNPDQTQPQKAKSSPVSAREARLKAALKANMGRRKAQARARAATDSPENETAADDAPNNNE